MRLSNSPLSKLYLIEWKLRGFPYIESSNINYIASHRIRLQHICICILLTTSYIIVYKIHLYIIYIYVYMNGRTHLCCTRGVHMYTKHCTCIVVPYSRREQSRAAGSFVSSDSITMHGCSVTAPRLMQCSVVQCSVVQCRQHYRGLCPTSRIVLGILSCTLWEMFLNTSQLRMQYTFRVVKLYLILDTRSSLYIRCIVGIQCSIQYYIKHFCTGLSLFQIFKNV